MQYHDILIRTCGSKLSPTSPSGVARRVWCVAWRGVAWRGAARRARRGTGSGAVRCGAVRRGAAWRGVVWWGCGVV